MPRAHDDPRRTASKTKDDTAKFRFRIRVAAGTVPRYAYDGAAARRKKAERVREAEEWIAHVRARTAEKGTQREGAD